MSIDLPALPGDTQPEPLEPTAILPAPDRTPAEPASPTPTLLISSRTVTDTPPDQEPQPKAARPPRRSMAEKAKARKLRHARRRTQRAAARDAEPDPYEDDNEPADEPEQDERDRARLNYRRYQPRRHHQDRHHRRHGRLRTLAVTATAAGIGWQIGLEPGISSGIHHLGQASVSWAVSAGAAAVTAGAYLDFVLRGGRSPSGAIRVRDVRSWGLIFVVIARIPLGSALLALCLYAPGSVR
jgi:hypothetical protein